MPAEAGDRVTTCMEPGCNNPKHSRGRCNTHYHQWWAATNPEKRAERNKLDYRKRLERDNASPEAIEAARQRKREYDRAYHENRRKKVNVSRRQAYPEQSEENRKRVNAARRIERPTRTAAKPVEASSLPIAEVNAPSFEDRMKEYRRIYEEAQKRREQQ